MAERCPGSKFICKARLEGYKFVYDGNSKTWAGAVANVIESKGDTIWGGLFEITEEHLNSLNKCEGYPNVYKRKKLAVTDEQTNTHFAYVYLREHRKLGEPSEEYKQRVMEGANDCSLDPDYIENIINNTTPTQF